MQPSSAVQHLGQETAEPVSGRTWSAVGSLAMCVTLLIAAEFLPVSLLTPIARDLHATEGMAGQAISISGLFAVLTSLLIAWLAGRMDRRHVLLGLTATMLVSLVVIAQAQSFAVLMFARALLGIVIGGFWSLSAATVMRLIPPQQIAKALGIVYGGNAVATAFAAPIGSYFGAIIGWRGVFWAMVPLALLNFLWQWVSLPAIPSQQPTSPADILRLLQRRYAVTAILAVMLTFGGAFSTFTYFRPFLESFTKVTVPQLSFLLLCLGSAGFLGTALGGKLSERHLAPLLRWAPLALAAVTLTLLAVGRSYSSTGMMLLLWGTVNSAIPVAWSTWQTRGFADQPESGGGLLIAAIQLSIMLGAGFGGLLLDHLSIRATFYGGALLLTTAFIVVGRGDRIFPSES